MPVPFYANSVEDREVLLAQRGISEVLQMAEAAPLKLIGIGTAIYEAQLVVTGLIHEDEIEAISAEGGCGEILGHFFDADGNILGSPLAKRTIAASLGDGTARNERIVGLAGGPGKVDAIRAALNSGRLSGFIADERTARALVSDTPVASAP